VTETEMGYALTGLIVVCVAAVAIAYIKWWP
jgi:hypothetical protein